MPGEDINTTLRFNADITDFKSAMQEATRSAKLANSEFKAVAAGMDDWGSSTDGLQAKLSQLSAVQQAEERKLEVLRVAYQKVAQEQGETSAAAVELQTKINNQQAVVNKTAKEYEKYSAKLDEVEKGADDAADEIKDVGDAAKEAGEKAEESGEGWTIVKDVIADMVSNTISWAIDSFKELLTASSSALSALGAKTGATTEQLSKYNDVMKDIYRNNFGESFDDVSEAMSEVIAMFGDLDKASLQGITEKAITLRDTFDMDYKESLRAVNSLMDQFGITSDEAFNLIAQGAQSGLNQNDDLLDTINEYSVQFKTAGYSADNMFNMLANGAESGTWSVDKLGDAVKEFNIRAKDGTVSEALYDYADGLLFTEEQCDKLSRELEEGGEVGKKAYAEILASMNNLESPTARYTAGVALFGTMWEDLGETTIQSLMKTEGGITSTKDAMEQMANVRYDNLNDAMSGLGRVIQSDLIMPIVDKLEPIARDIVNWLIANMGTLEPIIIGVATAVGILAAALAISGTISAVQKALALLNITLLANPFVLVAALIAGLVAAFVALWNKSDAFRNFFLNMWSSITNGVSSAITWISNGFTSLVKWFTQLPGKIASAISGAVGKVTSWGQNLYNAAKTKVTETVSGVTSWFAQLPGKIASAISGAVDSVAQWGRNLVDKGKTAASNLVSAVVDGVKSLPGKMLDVGKNLVSGLWNGISNSFTWIKEKISGWVGNVLDFIQNLFGIHSPSTETEWQGKMLVAGYVNALNKGKKDVAKAMQGLGEVELDALGVPSNGTGTAGGKTINLYQTNNSPRALSRREIYRQTHNALAYAGGV